jgi:hypothetical protein
VNIKKIPAIVFALASLSAYADPLRFYGYAYDLKSGDYLYTEVYNEELKEGFLQRCTMKYFAADGHPLGEKKVAFDADPYLPVYQLDLPSANYSEGITQVHADAIEMFKQSGAKARQTATVTRTPDMAADAGFTNFMVAHLPELAAGKTVNFKLGVAGLLDAYSFRARRVGTTEFEGQTAVNLSIEPDSLLRYLVDPLLLTYDIPGKRLLEYRGVSDVINPATGKAYTVRVAFYTKAPADAPKNLPPPQ